MSVARIVADVELLGWHDAPGENNSDVYSERSPDIRMYLSQDVTQEGVYAVTALHLHPEPRKGRLTLTVPLSQKVGAIAPASAMVGFKMYTRTVTDEGYKAQKAAATTSFTLENALRACKEKDTVDLSLIDRGSYEKDTLPQRAVLRVSFLTVDLGPIVGQQQFSNSGASVTELKRDYKNAQNVVVRSLDGLFESYQPAHRALDRIHTSFASVDSLQRMPASAYVLEKPVAPCSERYLVGLMQQALFECGITEEAWMSAIDTQLADTNGDRVRWNFTRAMGAIVRASVLLCTSLPYLTDVANDGANTIKVTERYNDLRATGAPDCEEGGKDSINILYHEFSGGRAFSSPLLQRAQRALALYVPMQELYAVTSAAATGAPIDGGGNYSSVNYLAHEASSLIPRETVVWLLNATAASSPRGEISSSLAAFARTARPREANFKPWEKDLLPLFGEGTGNMWELQAPAAAYARGDASALEETQARLKTLKDVQSSSRALRSATTHMRPSFEGDANGPMLALQSNGGTGLNHFKKWTVSMFTPGLLAEWTGIPCTKLAVVSPQEGTYGVPYAKWCMARRLPQGTVGLLPMDVWDGADGKRMLQFMREVQSRNEPIRPLDVRAEEMRDEAGLLSELSSLARQYPAPSTGAETAAVFVGSDMQFRESGAALVSGVKAALSAGGVSGMDFRAVMLTTTAVGMYPGVGRVCVRLYGRSG